MTEKKVCFDSIDIFEHANEIGDNPAVTSGVPLTISWECQHYVSWDLDQYEALRGPRKVKNRLRLPVHERTQLLVKCGYSIEDIITRSLQVREEREARAESIKNKKWDGLHQAIESTTRKFKKVARRGSLTLRRRSSSTDGDLEEDPYPVDPAHSSSANIVPAQTA